MTKLDELVDDALKTTERVRELIGSPHQQFHSTKVQFEIDLLDRNIKLIDFYGKAAQTEEQFKEFQLQESRRKLEELRDELTKASNMEDSKIYPPEPNIDPSMFRNPKL